MTGVLAVSLDGITPIPPGHVGTIKTYLEMAARPRLAAIAEPRGYALERIGAENHIRYRAIFRALGERWLWWSRLMLTDEALAATLSDARLQAFAVTFGGRDVGLLELDFRNAEAPDLAFLGLVDGHTGRGVGGWLMGVAQTAFWSKPIAKVTVNTCTLDHPAALGFYRRCGFRPVLQAIEIVPDPRLTGLLPETAAPHIPILAPG